MKGILVGAIMAGAIFSSACAHASVSRSVRMVDTSYRANPIATDDVFVYEEGDSIPEHTRVAILDAEGIRDRRSRAHLSDLFDSGSGPSDGDLRNALREEAGRIGANAIIWGDVEKPSFLLRGFQHRVTLSAVAIYVPSLGRGGDDNR